MKFLPKTPLSWWQALLLSVFVLLSVLLFTGLLQWPGDWAREQLIIFVCIVIVSFFLGLIIYILHKHYR